MPLRVATGPGADLSDQARNDLAAMFTAYDEGGLVGDPAVLARAARTGADDVDDLCVAVSRSRALSCGDSIVGLRQAHHQKSLST